MLPAITEDELEQILKDYKYYLICLYALSSESEPPIQLISSIQENASLSQFFSITITLDSKIAKFLHVNSIPSIVFFRDCVNLATLPNPSDEDIQQFISQNETLPDGILQNFLDSIGTPTDKAQELISSSKYKSLTDCFRLATESKLPTLSREDQIYQKQLNIVLTLSKQGFATKDIVEVIKTEPFKTIEFYYQYFQEKGLISKEILMNRFRSQGLNNDQTEMALSIAEMSFPDDIIVHVIKQNPQQKDTNILIDYAIRLSEARNTAINEFKNKGIPQEIIEKVVFKSNAFTRDEFDEQMKKELMGMQEKVINEISSWGVTKEEVRKYFEQNPNNTQEQAKDYFRNMIEEQRKRLEEQNKINELKNRFFTDEEIKEAIKANPGKSLQELIDYIKEHNKNFEDEDEEVSQERLEDERLVRDILMELKMAQNKEEAVEIFKKFDMTGRFVYDADFVAKQLEKSAIMREVLGFNDEIKVDNFRNMITNNA